MSDPYPKQRAIAVADIDAIESAQDEIHKQIENEIDLTIESNTEPAESDTEPIPVESAGVAQFESDPSITAVQDKTDTVGKIRKTALDLTEETPTPDKTTTDMHRLQKASDRIDLIESLNAELEDRNRIKRYFVSKGKVDAAEPVFEDAIGKYRYQTEKYRPSEMAESLDEWRKLDKREKVLKTVATLVEVYPIMMDDVAGTHHAGEVADDMLVTTSETADQYDVFGEDVAQLVGDVLERTEADA